MTARHLKVQRTGGVSKRLRKSSFFRHLQSRIRIIKTLDTSSLTKFTQIYVHLFARHLIYTKPAWYSRRRLRINQFKEIANVCIQNFSHLDGDDVLISKLLTLRNELTIPRFHRENI